jgi:LPXTG-motif cell wall-anchored protein
MTEGLDILLGWLGLAVLLSLLVAVMYRRSRRR